MAFKAHAEHIDFSFVSLTDLNLAEFSKKIGKPIGGPEPMGALTRNQTVFSLWSDIQDAIGPCQNWPFEIRKLFWTAKINNWQRCKLVNFSYVNGLHPDIFKEWCALMHLLSDAEAVRHIEYLIDLYSKGIYPPYMWAWNIDMAHNQYLDGERKIYGVKRPKISQINVSGDYDNRLVVSTPSM
jgi:hypothetical protein